MLPNRPPGDICPRCLRNQETESMTGDEDDASVIDSLIADDSYQSYLRVIYISFLLLINSFNFTYLIHLIYITHFDCTQLMGAMTVFLF